MSYAFVSTGGPVERVSFPTSTVNTKPGKTITVTLDANAQELVSSETNQNASAIPPSDPKSD